METEKITGQMSKKEQYEQYVQSGGALLYQKWQEEGFYNKVLDRGIFPEHPKGSDYKNSFRNIYLDRADGFFARMWYDHRYKEKDYELIIRDYELNPDYVKRDLDRLCSFDVGYELFWEMLPRIGETLEVVDLISGQYNITKWDEDWTPGGGGYLHEDERLYLARDLAADCTKIVVYGIRHSWNDWRDQDDKERKVYEEIHQSQLINMFYHFI